MIYLQEFDFPTAEAESYFFAEERRTCYDTFYPFQVLSKKRFSHMELAPITILYGGNGSGKTTALNVIAEKLACQRDTIYNKSNFFPGYVQLCTGVLGEIGKQTVWRDLSSHSNAAPTPVPAKRRNPCHAYIITH